MPKGFDTLGSLSVKTQKKKKKPPGSHLHVPERAKLSTLQGFAQNRSQLVPRNPWWDTTTKGTIRWQWDDVVRKLVSTQFSAQAESRGNRPEQSS